MNHVNGVAAWAQIDQRQFSRSVTNVNYDSSLKALCVTQFTKVEIGNIQFFEARSGKLRLIHQIYFDLVPNYHVYHKMQQLKGQSTFTVIAFNFMGQITV